MILLKNWLLKVTIAQQDRSGRKLFKADEKLVF